MKKKRVQKIIAWIVTFAFTFQAIYSGSVVKTKI